jgi:opacity protein-like surface antigen
MYTATIVRVMAKLKSLSFLVLMATLAPAAAGAQTGSPDWSGIYLGGHAGYARARMHYVEPDDPDFAIHPRTDGFRGGPMAGFSRQRDRLVFGVEGDLGLGRLRHAAGDIAGDNEYSQIDVDWNAHVRGTLGRAWNGTLLFAAAGLAVARVTLDDIDPDFGDDRRAHPGWTIGGGLARQAGSRLIVRIEYLFDSYGKKRYAIESPPGPYFPEYAADIDVKTHTVRGGITYRF